MESNSKQYRCMYSSFALTSESNFNLGGHGLGCLQEKNLYQATIGKRDERVKPGYGNHH